MLKNELDKNIAGVLQKKYDWTKQYVEEMITETELALKFEERRDVEYYKMS